MAISAERENPRPFTHLHNAKDVNLEDPEIDQSEMR
jgi:hypothetical protein